MIVISILTYIAVAVWFLCCSDKNQRASAIVGTLLSSFFCFWYWGESTIAVLIHLAVGLVFIVFYWALTDGKIEPPPAQPISKGVAGVLALLFGSFGIHKFYLRKYTLGLLYILFSWTFVPGVIGVIEAIRLFAMSEAKFHALRSGVDAAVAATTATQTTEVPHTESAPVTPEVDYAAAVSQADERNGDDLNYRNVRVCGYAADAIGSVEDFSIVVKTNGQTYTFKAKNGDICSYRSSSMRSTKFYEVTEA